MFKFYFENNPEIYVIKKLSSRIEKKASREYCTYNMSDSNGDESGRTWRSVSGTQFSPQEAKVVLVYLKNPHKGPLTSRDDDEVIFGGALLQLLPQVTLRK